MIALWLGHEKVETTQIYLHADLTVKERALVRTTPTNSKPGRYRPPDAILAFLETLCSLAKAFPGRANPNRAAKKRPS